LIFFKIQQFDGCKTVVSISSSKKNKTEQIFSQCTKADAFIFTNSNVGISFISKLCWRGRVFSAAAQESRLSAAAEAFSYLIDAARALFLYKSIHRHAHLFRLGLAHMKY
jgi:hypothetical protein